MTYYIYLYTHALLVRAKWLATGNQQVTGQTATEPPNPTPLGGALAVCGPTVVWGGVKLCFTVVVTVRTHGDFIVLPYWGTRLLAP